MPFDPAIDMSALAQDPIVGGDFDDGGRVGIAESGSIFALPMELLFQGRSTGFIPMGANLNYADPNASPTDFSTWWNSTPTSVARRLIAFDRQSSS